MASSVTDTTGAGASTLAGGCAAEGLGAGALLDADAAGCAAVASGDGARDGEPAGAVPEGGGFTLAGAVAGCA